jgi:hypothetical protein
VKGNEAHSLSINDSAVDASMKNSLKERFSIHVLLVIAITPQNIYLYLILIVFFQWFLQNLLISRRNSG